MDAGDFDELALFRALSESRVRALLIGRRALIALGVPVLTSDYDYWIHIDDIEEFNAAVQTLDLVPNHDPVAARARGRYVVEGDQRIEVLVARSQSTKDGIPVVFDEVWARRRRIQIADGAIVAVPEIGDLILTKKWSMRVKDLPDIQLLEALRREETGEP